MPIEIIWSDPPPQGRYGTALSEFADVLKQQPNEWAELGPIGGEHFPITVGSTLRAMDEHLEVTMRPTDVKNRNRLWARWCDEPPVRSKKGRKPKT